MAELLLNERMEKAQTESNLSITNTNKDMNIELKKEFLVELLSNAYHGKFNEDVVDHIAKVLELLDLIKNLNVDTDRLRVKIYGRGNNESSDDIVSSDDEWEEYEYGNPPDTTTDSLFKPYMKTQEKNNIKREDE
ncbi:hypothetical protein Tco_0237518 [Tanacetum coccineum]